jgi:hypothetical protein
MRLLIINISSPYIGQFSCKQTYLVTTDTRQKDRVGRAALLETLIGEGVVLGINGGTTDEGLLELDLESKTSGESVKNALGSFCDFGSNTISGKKGHSVGVLLADGVERTG